jgi:hypothetical protein
MEYGFLIFGLIFTSVFLFIFGSYLTADVYKEKRAFKKRLERIEGGIEEINLTESPAEESPFTRFVRNLGKFLAPKKEENISEMRRLFIRAGYRSPRALPLFFGLKVFLALSLFGAILVGRLFFWQLMTPASFTYLSIILAIVGFYLPNLWIKFRISNRKDNIDDPVNSNGEIWDQHCPSSSCSLRFYAHQEISTSRGTGSEDAHKIDISFGFIHLPNVFSRNHRAGSLHFS